MSFEPGDLIKLKRPDTFLATMLRDPHAAYLVVGVDKDFGLVYILYTVLPGEAGYNEHGLDSWSSSHFELA